MNMQTPTHAVEQGPSCISVFSELRATLEKPFHSAKPVKRKSEAAGCDSSRPMSPGVATPHQQPFAPLPVVQITCAADIKPEPIRWLWDGWLARGKFHIFAGQAGTGKTTIAIAIGATISSGGHFPDGTRAPVGNVLIWSGEDSAKDTLVPRLLAAGADMKRVHIIGDVQHGDKVRSFDPATDIRAMFDTATRIGDISLLIVDPVVNAVAGDSHKNTEVRRALQPLVDLGEKFDCAVLGISHFSKGTGGKDPMDRVTGSLAFAALARVVLATGKINNSGTAKRIFCRAKSNIGEDHGGFEYDLLQKEIEGHAGVISSYSVWGKAVEGTATELLAESEPDDGEGANAEQFLRETLAGGAMPQKDLVRECKDAGFSVATLRRAKKQIGIVSKKDGMRGVWFWSLPDVKHEDAHEDVEDAQQSSVSTFGEIEHLREIPP
jgi:putative DNA primase/helicase